MRHKIDQYFTKETRDEYLDEDDVDQLEYDIMRVPIVHANQIEPAIFITTESFTKAIGQGFFLSATHLRTMLAIVEGKVEPMDNTP